MQLGFSKAQSYKRKKKSNYWTTIRLVRKLARKALEIILMMKQKVAPTSKTKWQRTQIYAKAEAGVCVSKSIRESSVTHARTPASDGSMPLLQLGVMYMSWFMLTTSCVTSRSLPSP